MKKDEIKYMTLEYSMIKEKIQTKIFSFERIE